jgi:(S)-citramalyl-CoA lyase
MFPKALASGADMVCLELEDGIAPKDKDEARQKTLALFSEKQPNDGVERLVRINSLREAFGIADVQAILTTDSPPPALMIPKVKSPDEIIILDNLLTERGHDTRLHIIIETNEGLESAFDIAHSSSRIDSMLFGGIDMAAELRCDLTWESLLYARSRCVHAAASAGLDIIDVPYLDLEDQDGMRVAGEQAKSLGFSGKGSIHPKQIGILNKIFTPNQKEINRARHIIEAYEKADTGLVVIDGKLIEKPVMREMYRIASIAKKLNS